MSRHRKRRPPPPHRNGDPAQYQHKTHGEQGPGASLSGGGPGGLELRNPEVIKGMNGEDIQVPKGFALPHPATFASIIQGASRVYSWRWDEALKHNRGNARAMRRDAFLQGLLNERRRQIVRHKWHLEPEDASSKVQKEAVAALTADMRRIPRFRQFVKNLLRAVWFGRYANQMAWDWVDVGAERHWLPVDHIPVHGDKIQYRYRVVDDGPEVEDGTPCILVHAQQSLLLPGATTVLTDRGRALLLDTPFWRERFCIHNYEPEDMDFDEGEMSGGIWGVGIRSTLYWIDWLRQEWLSWVSDFLERAGLGTTIIYFEAGNKQAEKLAFKAASEISRRTVLVLPRLPGQSGNTGNSVDRVETPVSGAECLVVLVKHLEDIEERFVVGQSLSAGSDRRTGWGSLGQAMMAENTKHDILEDDARSIEDPLTWLVGLIQKYNYPRWSDFRVRFVWDLAPPENGEKLQAAKLVKVDMGIPVKDDEVRELAGFSTPQAGDTVSEPPEKQLPGAGGGGKNGGSGGKKE